MNVNDLLYSRQFGFRKKHSTTDAVVNFVGEVLSAFDGGYTALSVFVDLRKAFDTVSHSLILSKLKCIGICDKELRWFTDYLTNRKQLVQLGGCSSDMASIDVGVPQGSLLGVLLFEILINDVVKSLKFCSSILYADDTTLFVIGRSVRFLRIKMQSDLNALSEWLRINSLKLNVKKTKAMVLNKEGLSPNVDLDIDGQYIECVSCFKMLGILIDSDMSFQTHFSSLYEKLLRSVYLIRKLAKMIPMYCLRVLYFAYYHSHLTYGLLIWYPLLSINAQKSLFTLQKRLVRCLCSAPFRQHCMPLFKSLSILTLPDQMLVENAKLYHKIVHNECPTPIQNLYRNVKSNYETRYRGPIAVSFKSVLVNKSFLCKPIIDWQNLTCDQKNVTNTKLFCKKLKKSIITSY